jgi:hypothetical protein
MPLTKKSVSPPIKIKSGEKRLVDIKPKQNNTIAITTQASQVIEKAPVNN